MHGRDAMVTIPSPNTGSSSPEARFGGSASILTPDQRLRVFVSSTLNELAGERAAVRRAIEQLHLTPVMFELGARPHPPRALYLSYLRQSHVFVGIYGEQYGWIGPDMTVSGLEDELLNAGDMACLLYVKTPAPARDERLNALIERVRRDGRTSYKTFSSAEELAARLADDLAVLFSERFTSSPANPPRMRVPSPPSDFVGRSAQLNELVELLTSEGVRLVTLTGPGGIGKTRLAIEVARGVADWFADGVVFVPLATRAPDDFLEAIGTAVGISDLGQAPLPQLLAEQLHDRQQLLVLDNFEQLVSAAGDLARLIQESCALRLLVTSRAALRLSSEEEFPVPPMTLPRVTSRVTDVERAEAAQLFARRVAAVRHGYRITERDAAEVARICNRLDGLPLAVELVAARANVMSIQDLASRLDTVLDLSARSADIPERQRTLRQTMDWSYAQLPPSAATAFAQLGAFAGSFSLRAAEAVVDVKKEDDILDLLSVLVDHSLLRPDLDTDGTRFSMLEIVSEYARSRLDPSCDSSLRERHARYYRGIATEAFTGLRGTGQHAMIAQLDRDADDVAAALDWLLTHGRLTDVADMCWSLWLYYWLRNSVTEGRRWTRGALESNKSLPRRQRGRLLAADAFLAAWKRDYVLANDELTEALDIADTERDDDLELLTSIMLIIVDGGLGEVDHARLMADQAVHLARRNNDRWSEAVALTGLCWLNAAVERFGGEEATFEKMLVAARDSQDPLWTSLAEDNMAELRIWQGDHTRAANDVIDSLRQLARLRMAYAGVGSLNTAAWLLSRVDDWRGAVTVLAAADSIMERMNAGLWPLWVPRRERMREEARRRLGDSDFENAVQSGEKWTFERATAEAIGFLTPVADDEPRREAAQDDDAAPTVDVQPDFSP